MKKEKAKGHRLTVELGRLRNGKDEMNLAEFSLASVCTRQPDGKKSLVYSDQVWDGKQKKYVPRELWISGSDKYGLPTARDDDILLACFQLSRLTDFKSRELEFSRYQVLKLLRCNDGGRNYDRVKQSLRRWKGLTVYSDRNFWDHLAGSFVDKDFGVIDNLFIYERERKTAETRSRLLWNEVLWRSCQAGYIKDLDWEFYVGLQSHVAKRLYRLLDKRFWREKQSRFVFRLKELAFKHVGLSPRKSNSQIKQELNKGIAELEAKWPDFVPLRERERYRPLGKPGEWEAIFRKKKTPRKKAPVPKGAPTALVNELMKRGLTRSGKTGAEALAKTCDPERIRHTMRIYDHKKKKGENASPGFIVEGCLRAEPYTLPTALVTCGQAASEQRPTRNDRPQGAGPKRAKGARVAQDDGDRIAFLRYWKSLGFTEKITFEKKALESTAALNRDCYLAFVRAENGSPDMVSAPIERVRRHCGSRFEDYRDVILVEHFRRLNLESGVSAKPGSPQSA